MSGRARALVLWATIPYLLLSGSQWASLQTRIYLNGSAKRTVEVAVDPSRQGEIIRWLRDSDVGIGAQESRQKAGSIIISRSRMAANPDSISHAIRLQVQDIAQNPLALFTYYHWNEDLYIEPSPATQVELAGQPQAKLYYEIVLPGEIVPSSVSPQGAVEEGRVSWQLPASAQVQPVRATSRAFRWGYALVLLYILAFISYRVGVDVDRVLGYRPRRI